MFTEKYKKKPQKRSLTDDFQKNKETTNRAK